MKYCINAMPHKGAHDGEVYFRQIEFAKLAGVAVLRQEFCERRADRIFISFGTVARRLGLASANQVAQDGGNASIRTRSICAVLP
jgi:hypothetical protein